MQSPKWWDFCCNPIAAAAFVARANLRGSVWLAQARAPQRRGMLSFTSAHLEMGGLTATLLRRESNDDIKMCMHVCAGNGGCSMGPRVKAAA